jgi:hypothetical protein
MARRPKEPKTPAELDETIGSLRGVDFEGLGFDGIARRLNVSEEAVLESVRRFSSVPAELLFPSQNMRLVTSPLFAKLPAARARVGSDHLARLKWLLAFARGENKDASDLATEVFAFAAPSNKPIHDPYPPNGSFRELTPEKIQDLEQQVRAGIRAVHAGREWETPPLSLAFVANNGRRFYRGPAADCFLAAAVDLAVAERARIHLCEWAECKRLFVKNKRAKYCSRQCSAKARFSRWRKDHFLSDDEFSVWRHKRYKSQHPRAKVRRRRKTDAAGQIAET